MAGYIAGIEETSEKIINFYHHHYTSEPFSIFYCIIKDSTNFFHFTDDGRKWSEERRRKEETEKVYSVQRTSAKLAFSTPIMDHTQERVTCFRKQIY